MDMTTDSESGRSLSSWRAWIEISQGLAAGRHDAVALLMESVDLNPDNMRYLGGEVSRSPHGERGLKLRFLRA